MKPRLATTALFVFSLFLVPTGAALATGPGKEHADKPKNATHVQYGKDEAPKGDKAESDETLMPPAEGGGGPSAGEDVKPGAGGPGASGAGGATGTASGPASVGAPGSTTSTGGPGAATPGSGLPGSPTVAGPLTTTPSGPAPGTPAAGGPSTVAPGGPSGGDTSTPGAGGPSTAPSQGGVAGDVTSGGPNGEARQAPTTGDVRAGEQVAAAAGSGLAFTGFAAIPMLLVGLAVLAGGLLLRRSRSTI